MFAPVASNMEHITPASSNEDGGKYPLLEHHQFNTSAHHRNMPLFDESAHSFSLGALPQQNRGHSTSQNQPLLHSQAAPSPPHSEPHRGEAGDALLSGYNNYVGYASSVNQSVSSNYVGHLSYGTLLKTGILPDAPTVSCTSPEAVLDVLSVIQQKLQQMQDVVQLMVQGGGQHAMPQQQQSLAAGVASIMSQLFAATAGLLQQPAPSSIQFPPSALQLNQAFDLRFDGFHDDGVNNPLSASLGSFMDSSHESFFPSNNGRSTLMGGVATSSATRVAMGGSGIGKAPGLIDQRLKEQALISSSGDPKNCLAPGNTPSNSFEIEFTKESPSSAVEAGNSHGMDGIGNQVMLSLEDHDYASVLREDDDDGEGENLPPGSYELMEMAAAEILAEHTHFCEICGKGFKRDANLRMHMRGHGDEYKTPSALARPDKTTHDPSVIRLRRYSCPYVGCKRNKKHRKFQPLKTMLCVKNHYRRSHCPKLLTCSKCKTKKFSVVADLKTHEKHCGRDKWQCSCGTTFSRKDKLFGHISLFAGHTPAVPIHETESPVGGIESSSGCFSSGYGEGLEGLTGNEAAYLATAGSANVAQGSGPAINATLMTGSSNGMDMTGVSVMGQGVHRSDGNSQQYSAHRGNCLSFSEGSNGTLVGDGSSSSSSLVGALGSDSSMLYDLLPGNFLHQVDGEKSLLLGDGHRSTIEVVQHCG